MISYVWPIMLVVLSNVAYQICAKSVPEGMDPLASLTVTYTVGAVMSGVLFFALNRHGIHRPKLLSGGGFIVCGLSFLQGSAHLEQNHRGSDMPDRTGFYELQIRAEAFSEKKSGR